MARTLREGYEIVASQRKAQRGNEAVQQGRYERASRRGVMAESQLGLRASVRHSRRDITDNRHRMDANVERYGTALGEQVASSFAPAMGYAKGGVQKAKYDKQSGKENQQTLAGMMGIYGRGVNAVTAAAQAAINQALAGEGLAAQAAVIELAGGILQSNMAMQQQMALMRYEQKLAQKAAEAAGPDASSVQAWMDGTATDIIQFAASTNANDYQLAEGGFDINAAVADFALQRGINPEAPTEQDMLTLQALRATYGRMNTSGVSASEAFNDSMGTMFGGYDWWGSVAQHNSTYTTTWEQTARDAYADAVAQTAPADSGMATTSPEAASAGLIAGRTVVGAPTGVTSGTALGSYLADLLFG